MAEVRPEERQEGSSGDAPENNLQYTTVYVGNLAHEVQTISSFSFYILKFSFKKINARCFALSLNQSGCIMIRTFGE